MTTIILFSLLTAPLGYLIRILYSQTLTIEQFGLFYAVFAFINFFTLYNDLGFGSSLAFYTPKFKKKENYINIWSSYKYSQIITIIVSLIISLVLFFSADWLSLNYFKVPEAKNLIYILIVFFLTNGFITITSSFFVGLQKELYYSSKEFIRLFFTLAFSVIFWLFDQPNIIFYALAWSAAHLVTALVFYYLLYKKSFHLIAKLKWDRTLFDKLLKYAIPSILVTSLYSLITSTDIFFLTAFRGVRDVGVYNIILPIISIPTFLLVPLSNFFIPLTSSLMEEKKEKISKIIESILVYVPFFVFYFMFFVILNPSQSINFLFGKKWLGLAENPLIILAVGAFFSNISYYLSIIALGMGFAKERLRVSAVIALTNLILSSLLIYFYGLLGAAIAYSLIYFISILLYGSLIKSTVSFKYPIVFYVKLIVFGLIFYLLILQFNIKLDSKSEFIVGGIIYTALITALAYFIGLFDKKMLKLFVHK